MINNEGRVHFMNLDVLRFFAAYMVVVLHAFLGWQANWGSPSWMMESGANLSTIGLLINKGANNLAFGVEIFFLLSGFLITYLLLAEREKTGTVNIFKFYVRRAFRIWPLYFLILLGGPIFTYYFEDTVPEYAYHFAFLGNFELIKNASINPVTAHLWSICVEEHFYLICPVILCFIPVKKIPQALLSIVFISILFRYFIFSDPNFGAHLYLNTLSRIDTLAIGCLLGYAVYFRKIQFNDPLPVRLMIYGVFLLMFFTESFKAADTAFEAGVKKYLFILPAAYWMGNFVFNAGALLAPKKENFLHLLGKASYGVYMFNPLIIGLLIKYNQTIPNPSMLVFILCVNASLLLVTLVSYYYFEMPFLKLKEKFSVIPSGNGKHAGQATKQVDIPGVALASVSDVKVKE